MRGLVSVGIDSLYQKSQPCVVSCLLELTVFIRSRSHAWSRVCWNSSLYHKSQPCVVSCLLELTVFIRSCSHAWSRVCWNWQSLSEVAAMRGLVSVGIESLSEVAAMRGLVSVGIPVFIISRSHAWSRVCWNWQSLSEVAAMRGLVSVGIDSLYQKSQPCVVSCLLELTVFIRSRSHVWSRVCWNWQSLSEVAAMRGLVSVGIDSLYQKSQPCVVSCLLELTVFIRSCSHAWFRVCLNWQSLSEVAAMRGLVSVWIDSLYQKSQPCVVSCLFELTVFIRSRSHGLVSVRIAALLSACPHLMRSGVRPS